MTFIHDQFLLTTPLGQRLYHEYTAAEPILDFHNHLSARQICDDRQFVNLYELWLEEDHYKWRALRANGVPESLITGSATPFDKFSAWAETLPQLLGHPLHHWTHLELQRLFGITDLLDPSSAREIWDQTITMLADPNFSAQGILRWFRVAGLCTTDDPVDDLTDHLSLAANQGTFHVYPTFRPDKALAFPHREMFLPWLERLESASQRQIGTLDQFLEALRVRHAAFHAAGCRLSDHGLPYCYADDCHDRDAAAIFSKALDGRLNSELEIRKLRAYLMRYFALMDAGAGWGMQLHLGALRNNNSRLAATLGADCGCDSIGDWPQAHGLGKFLDRLDADGALPRMIVYCMNPSDYYPVATMLGNFQREGTPASKLQLGPAWWFQDHDRGMCEQLAVLSRTMSLGRCVGMVTDSRSFASMARHDYFRRVLCDWLGRQMEWGRMPSDVDLVGSMAKRIAYNNAAGWLGLPGLVVAG